MVNDHINKIFKNQRNQLKSLLNICESEIEKLFLVKVIAYISNRPNEFTYSFLCEPIETEVVNGTEVVKFHKGFYKDAYDAVNVVGVKIEKKIDDIFFNLFPQKVLKSDFLAFAKQYRLDFSMEKHNNKEKDTLLHLYCIECDGHEFHSTKDQISSDNKRVRDLLLQNRYTTLRYSGSELFKWGDEDVGYFLFNL